jgi:tRNA-dihydrouridine synthase A
MEAHHRQQLPNRERRLLICTATYHHPPPIVLARQHSCCCVLTPSSITFPKQKEYLEGSSFGSRYIYISGFPHMVEVEREFLPLLRRHRQNRVHRAVLFFVLLHINTTMMIHVKSLVFPAIYRPTRRSRVSLSQLSSSSTSGVGPEDRRNVKYNQLMDASTLSLAPMMDYTDRHFRHLVRLLSRRTLLYTEMVAGSSLSHERQIHKQAYQELFPNESPESVKLNYADEYMQRSLVQGSVAPLEGPSVLQLGGSDPKHLYEAAEALMEMSRREGRQCDYTAINLNCGCPSPKVAGKGCFGAALMENPELVVKLTRALHEGCEGELPINVKCRIGTDTKQRFTQQGYTEIDPEQEYRELCQFIETIASDGIVTDFSVHARIAVLSKSFSPADNRKIPPLKYDLVRRLVQDYPELTFTLNGGVETIHQVKNELDAAPGLKGVMIGRSFAADPWSFAMADQLLYGEASIPARNRWEILQQYGKHADEEEARGDPTRIRRFICKAVSPLFTGESNSKHYRIALDEIAGLPKKLQGNLNEQPPLSELILNVATKHLSEECLQRSPQESYERLLWAEEKRQAGSRSQAVTQWQASRNAASSA